jgi:hypothetical protein
MRARSFPVFGSALAVAAIYCGSVGGNAYGSALGSAGVPATLGWYEIPDTQLQSVCPENDFGGYGYPFADRCASVIITWSGGAFDPTRNRMIIWGGGHNDYLGNEIYALEMNELKFHRLTDPARPAGSGECPESLAGGTQPNARHTYNGLAYMKNVDRFFAMGGSKATCGYMSVGTWTFDFKTSLWQLMNPSGDAPRGDPGMIAVYDDNSGKVFVHDGANLLAYDFAKNAYTTLQKDASIDYHLTGAIDSKRKKMVLIGHGEQWIIDIGGIGYKQEKLGSTGGEAIIGTDSPGLVYDPVEDRLVAWQGGDTVYALDPDAKTWTPITYPHGPGPAIEWGTNGRWAYVPSLNAYVVVNQAKQNAFVFRWSSKGSGVKPEGSRARSGRAVLRFPAGLDQRGQSLGTVASDRDVNGKVFPAQVSNGPGCALNSVHVLRE